jgi:exosome complex exonuclease DIS3/RRP44
MGKLSISSNNIHEGRINCESLGFQVRIVGEGRLNRAMNGDVVAVRLLQEEEWVGESVLELEEQLDEEGNEKLEVEVSRLGILDGGQLGIERTGG